MECHCPHQLHFGGGGDIPRSPWPIENTLVFVCLFFVCVRVVLFCFDITFLIVLLCYCCYFLFFFVFERKRKNIKLDEYKDGEDL